MKGNKKILNDRNLIRIIAMSNYLWDFKLKHSIIFNITVVFLILPLAKIS